MFGRNRIRQLEAEAKVLREAIDWYAVNDHWKRRGIHPRGTPVRWEISPAQKDHGGRAREAQVKADRIRRGAMGRFADDLRQRLNTHRDERAAQESIDAAADHLKQRVHVPQPLTSREFAQTELT